MKTLSEFIVEGQRKELKRAFDQGLRDSGTESIIKEPIDPGATAYTAPGSPERDAQIKKYITDVSGGNAVIKAAEKSRKELKKRKNAAVDSIMKRKPKLKVTTVSGKTFREYMEFMQTIR